MIPQSNKRRRKIQQKLNRADRAAKSLHMKKFCRLVFAAYGMAKPYHDDGFR